MTHEPGRPGDPDARLRRAYARPRRAFDSHPDEALWERFACGELTADERAPMAEHVTRCPACADIYRAVVHVMGEARTFDPQVTAPVQPARASSFRAALALAATLLVVVGGVALYRMLPGAPQPPAGQPATTIAQPPATPQRSEPTPPLVPLALTRPDLKLPSELTVVMRGPDGARAQRFLEGFGRAIAPYRANRFDEAASRLGALTSAYPDSVETWFYLGVSRLFAEQPAEALDAFSRAGDGGAAGDDLPWYRAIALERTAQYEELLRTLSELCERPGPYRDRSCAGLRARK